MSAGETIGAAACGVLAIADAHDKAAAARALAVAWRAGQLAPEPSAEVPARPARPVLPRLGLPREVPKRKVTAAPAGRIALLHALAHIELNAVDLAADLIARFDPPAADDSRRAWFDDWVRVLDEEGKHFLLLEERLANLSARYGDLVAHDGLWQAAEETASDRLARLAVVPLVLEARGLDVTPAMIGKLERVGDRESAAVLRVIYEEEIGHVAAGQRWFAHFAELEGREPKEAWQDLVRRHFKGKLKPPFNAAARRAAGLSPDFYEELAA